MLALKKYWFHILIWVLMLAYLAFAPGLYVRFILKNGKPVQFEQKLPAVTDQIFFSVDHLDPVVSDSQELYHLWGWAFLREEPDQPQYERFIVLQSDAGTYFFPLKSSERTDVQEAFPDLTINVQNSGFSTFISKDVIQPGSYQIGIVFRHKTSNTVYYVITNKMAVRTANQFQLEIADAQPVISLSGNFVHSDKPIEFEQELPAVTDQIFFSVDRLDPVVSDGQELYHLWGWAFLREEPDQPQYERFIVLQSDAETYFFPLKSSERTDVQEAFPDLTIDIQNSGFSTFISKDVIQPGSYQVGIVFRHQTSNAVYYVITNKVVIRTEDQLLLDLANSQP